MNLIHTLLALMLAVFTSVAPLSASAENARLHEQANSAVSVLALDGANFSSCFDGERDPSKRSPQNEHCEACCLAHSHSNVACLPLSLLQIKLWAISLKPQAEAPLALPNRLYGLKRPPRA